MLNPPTVADIPPLSATNPIDGDVVARETFNELTKIRDPKTRQIRSPASLAKRVSNQKATSSAKAEIRSKLREDWDWPPLGSPNREPQGHLDLNLPDKHSSWCERDSDSSRSTSIDPYQYESPEDFAEPVAAKRHSRHQQAEEEATWNEGLRHFNERRNAWTGAKLQGSAPDSAAHNQSDGISHSPEETQEHQSLPNGDSSDTSAARHDFIPSAPRFLVPLAPPILPSDHEVRAAITPATYPSIYSKIIIQGQTPTIPINLHDLVNALVQGWQNDGEWPPKTEAERMLADARAATAAAARDGEPNGIKDGDGGGKRLARKSVGKVKKVLGLIHEGHDNGDEIEEGIKKNE